MRKRSRLPRDPRDPRALSDLYEKDAPGGSNAPPGEDKDAGGAGKARALFSKFRTILDSNTAILTAIAQMERMLGGEYIFDRAYLEKSAREIADLTHRTVYAINAMTGDAHLDLYDRYAALNAEVEDILAGRRDPGAGIPVLPLRDIRLEDRVLVGDHAAALAEIAGRLELPAPDGFAVAEAGWAPSLTSGFASWPPRPLEQAVSGAVVDLYVRRGARRVLIATEAVTPEGEVRRTETEADCEAGQVLAALRQGMDQALAAFDPPPGDLAAFRGHSLVLAAPPEGALGQIRTLAGPEAGCKPLLAIHIRLNGSPGATDSYLASRNHPYLLRESRIAPKPLNKPLPDGRIPADPVSRAWLRGSAVLTPDDCAWLAGAAMAAERLLGEPLVLDFAHPYGGKPLFLGVRPLPADPACPADSDVPEAGEILLQGGTAACLGAASGMVIHVRENDAAADFPYGALAVARSASPQLAPILKRASGVVTELGDAAGHLAAVAREYRVPALFGARGALAALPQGALATLDAEARTVRRGGIAPVPHQGWELSPSDPEFLLLRRLLQRIASLTLTDPDAKDFTADNCRSFHDLIHFAHEKAVESLANMRRAGKGKDGAKARPIALPVPLCMRLLDIGGAAAAGDAPARIEDIRSRPLAAFLAGVCAPGMWDQAPARFGMGDVISAMDKTFAALSANPAHAGENLAIAARSYCNISLRLGYHFSVVDAYLSENSSKNAVYFRFVGGMAPIAARARRAQFLRNVLAGYDFKVETQGDLVVARLKMIEPARGEEILHILGRLTAFTRQRDTGLLSDADAAALETLFLEKSGLADCSDAKGDAHV